MQSTCIHTQHPATQWVYSPTFRFFRHAKVNRSWPHRSYLKKVWPSCDARMMAAGSTGSVENTLEGSSQGAGGYSKISTAGRQFWSPKNEYILDIPIFFWRVGFGNFGVFWLLTLELQESSTFRVAGLHFSFEPVRSIEVWAIFHSVFCLFWSMFIWFISWFARGNYFHFWGNQSWHLPLLN